jgi:opacity protein-like surface antigen
MLMAAFGAAWPSRANAQDNRLRVSFGAATTTGGAQDGELALTGGVGYRFAERLSFDVELTRFEADNDGDFPFTIAGNQFQFSSGGQIAAGNRISSIAQPGLGLLIYPPIRQGVESDTILATLGFRYEFPVQAGRLLPYVAAGLGASRTERTFEFGPVPLAVSVPRIGLQAPIRFQPETVTRTGLAGSLGVGASLRVVGQLFVDADARYFRLDGDRNMGRLGGGVSYRF